MFLFGKIFSVGAYTFLHLVSSAAAQVRRSSYKYLLGFLGPFWWGGTLEHKPSSPGSCVTWPLGGMTGKQIKIIFCAGPGFHPPARPPSAGTLQSLGLTHTTPQQGCLPWWLRFLLLINHRDNKQQQDSCYSCAALDIPEAEPEIALRAPHDAQQTPQVKDDENAGQTCALTFLRDLTPWHNFPRSHNLQIQRGSFFSSTRCLSLPSGRNLSSANAWNCTNNNFGNKRMQSLRPSVKASAISVAWSCLNIDLDPVAGPLPQPHKLWDRPHLMHSGRKAAIEALERGYEHRTVGKKRLWSCVYYHHTRISVGRGKISLLKWFDLTDASQWKQLVKPSWSVFAEGNRSFLWYNSLHLHKRDLCWMGKTHASNNLTLFFSLL